MRDYEKTTFSDTSARYPFKAPDGYFDNLTARIMDRIPEDKHESATVVSMTNRTNRFGVKRISTVAVAASIALVAIVSGRLISAPSADIADESDAAMTAYYTDDELSSDEMMLYSMVDNNDIYDYLAGYEY